MNQSGHKEGRGRPSGPSHWLWNDYEISVFLLEWEVVEQEVGYPGHKTCKKVRAIRQRLYHRGLRKTWQDCLQLLLGMLKMHYGICKARPGIKPLFTPYAMEVYRILGHRLEWSHYSGPLSDGAGNAQFHMYSQTPKIRPTPLYKPWDYEFPVPLESFMGTHR